MRCQARARVPRGARGGGSMAATLTSAPAWAKVERLEKFSRSDPDGEWHACCPAHEDRKPSLSIGIGDDGRILLNCHKGCSFTAIARSLGCAIADFYELKPTGANGSTNRAT